MERRPKMLSGGQRQRVAMGRAIVRNPSVFLMDEPLSNLDAKLRVQMRADIAALQRELGVTTIYVTHDQIEAMTMGDRVAVMRKGVLQQVDDPQVLYDEPVNLFVAGFIGSPPMNMAEVTIVDDDGDGLAVAFGDQRVTIDAETLAARPALRDYVGRTVAIGIRSEDLSQPGPRNDVPEDRRLRSTALLTEALGSEIVVHFDVPAPPVRTEDAKELEEDSGMADLTGGAIETAGSKFVASFSPRSRVGPATPSRSASTRRACTSSTSRPAWRSADPVLSFSFRPDRAGPEGQVGLHGLLAGERGLAGAVLEEAGDAGAAVVGVEHLDERLALEGQARRRVNRTGRRRRRAW